MTRWFNRLVPPVALLTAAMTTGCGDDLPSVTSIERMRLLGAQSTVQGDPERATPKPGEKATLDFVVAFPSLDQDTSGLSSLFLTCTPPDRFTGIPICQEFLDAALTADTSDPGAALDLDEPLKCEVDIAVEMQGIGVACVSGDPSVTLTVPQDFEGDARLIRGVICEDGTPLVDPSDPLLFSCESNRDDAQEIRVHGTIFVEQDKEDRNHNPDPAGFSFKFDGRGWDPIDPADLPPEDDCETAVDEDKLLGIQALGTKREKYEIQIEYDDAARELFDGEPEIVEISSYGTAGDIERRFTIFDPEDTLFEDQLEWKAPGADKVGPDGRLVRFFFSVIDQRGGFALTTRALCLE